MSYSACKHGWSTAYPRPCPECEEALAISGQSMPSRHPTDADVEAMWQAIRETFPASVTAPGRPDVEREFYRVAGARCARAALSALPHYLRAVEEREGLIEALKPFLDEADRWAAWALEFKVTDYELSHCTGKVKVSALLNLRAALSRALALQSRAPETGGRR